MALSEALSDAQVSKSNALLSSVHILHSPSLLGALRGENVRLLAETLGPLCSQGANIITEHEPAPELLLAASDKGPGSTVDLNQANIPEKFRGTFAPFVPSEMNVRQLSNAMKHRLALEQASKIAASQVCPESPRFALIVEDDALFVKTVSQLVEQLVACAPADADIVMVSLPSPPSPDGGIGFVDIEKLFRSPPACDGYLVTPRAASALAAAMLPIRMPTPMQLHFTAKSLGLRVYVSTHNMFVDGSKIGTAVSSIVVNNLLIWNQTYCKLMDVLTETQKTGVTGPDGAAAKCALEAALEASRTAPFGGHPDTVALRARVFVFLGRLEEAKTSYEEAIAGYENGNAVFGMSCRFLRGYMDMYQHLQASNI